jgi:hypothetical protein
MAIIVEDGTDIPGANSYTDVAEFKLWCEDEGIDLSTYTDVQIETFLHQGFRYVESLNYKGYPTYANHTKWPREDVTVDGYKFSSIEIPEEIIDAQSFVASLVAQGVWSIAQGVGDLGQVVTETVGPISTTYANTATTTGTLTALTSIYPYLGDLLRPFLQTALQGLVSRG